MSALKERDKLIAAIVDYGQGNLFSLTSALMHVGFNINITHIARDLLAADVVFLPGVGAYSTAMAQLKALDLVGVFQDLANEEKPIVGICLGLQLLLERSFEFGVYEGLGIIKGYVAHMNGLKHDKPVRVPHIGWNAVWPSKQGEAYFPQESAMSQTPIGENLYFIHSYVAVPEEMDCVLSVSDYSGVEFVSALKKGSIQAFQFHPERSAAAGLQIFKQLFKSLVAINDEVDDGKL
jgi:imidazole glycerol-phosphate synthase subunit HisH